MPEPDYNLAIREIGYSGAVSSFGSIKSHLEDALKGIDDSISSYKANIVLEKGLGYAGNDALHNSFPGAKDSREEIENVTIVTLSKGDVQKKLYHSNELHIWVIGEPKKGKDGLYCRITGTNLSRI